MTTDPLVGPLRQALLKEASAMKRRLKKAAGLTAHEVRVHLSQAAHETRDALGKLVDIGAEKALELCVQAGMYDKAGNLMPEFGGKKKPVKKPKKKRK